MKPLMLTPIEFKLCLEFDGNELGMSATGGDSITMSVDSQEAQSIGEWFLALSKELKPKAKVVKK